MGLKALVFTITAYLGDESLCIYDPGPFLNVSGRRVWGGEGNGPPTAAEDGLSKACVCHIEYVCPILQGMEMAQHHRAAIALANLTQLPACSVCKEDLKKMFFFFFFLRILFP